MYSFGDTPKDRVWQYSTFLGPGLRNGSCVSKKLKNCAKVRPDIVRCKCPFPYYPGVRTWDQGSRSYNLREKKGCQTIVHWFTLDSYRFSQIPTDFPVFRVIFKGFFNNWFHWWSPKSNFGRLCPTFTFSISQGFF